MTARRSQDPRARKHDEGLSSAAEHWTPQRRRDAIPAHREVDLRPDLPIGQEEPGSAADAGGERAWETEKPERTCGNDSAASPGDEDRQE